MKSFTDVAAQGDVLLIKRNSLPGGLSEVAASDGRITVTHSETGHSHVLVLDREQGEVPNVRMYATDNPLIAWIKVNRPTALEHLRPHDTHEPIMFEPGVYEVRRQREHTPEGFRRVED